jgi:hypothetical protein
MYKQLSFLYKKIKINIKMKYCKENVNVLDEVVAGGVRYKKIYRGNYNKNHKPHGFGIEYFYPDLYIGYFKNGKKNGYGIMNCKEGYKLISKTRWRFMYSGIYIGIFKNNIFETGKVMEFNRQKKEKNVYFMTNSKINGEYKIFHQNYSFLFSYIDGELIGKYNYNGHYSVESTLYNGEFHGNTTITTKKGSRHFLYYENGIVQGKSIYFLPTSTFFILKWRDNICQKILCIRNQTNKLYYPDIILENLNIDIPIEFLCPIGYTLMIQPYTNEYKQTYEFNNVKTWMEKGKCSSEYFRDPMTNKVCHISSFKPNLNYQLKILKFIEKKLFCSKIFLLK